MRSQDKSAEMNLKPNPEYLTPISTSNSITELRLTYSILSRDKKISTLDWIKKLA
jgi:hypothetical protein